MPTDQWILPQFNKTHWKSKILKRDKLTCIILSNKSKSILTCTQRSEGVKF